MADTILESTNALTIPVFAIVGLDENGVDCLQGVAIDAGAADYYHGEIKGDAIEAIEWDDSVSVDHAKAMAASIRILDATVTVVPDQNWSMAHG